MPDVSIEHVTTESQFQVNNEDHKQLQQDMDPRGELADLNPELQMTLGADESEIGVLQSADNPF